MYQGCFFSAVLFGWAMFLMGFADTSVNAPMPQGFLND